MARRYGQDDADKPAPKNDVYTGLLAISFFAMLAGCLLLFLDWYSYPEGTPASLKITQLPGAKAPVAGVGKAKPAEKKVEEKKEEEPKKEDKKEEMKKEEMKKEEMKKEEAKKEEKKE
jgi:hypothetical protein